METGTSMEATAAATALRGISTLGELFAWRVGQSPQALAYRQYDSVAGAWRSYSWREIQLRVACWQRALSAQMLGAGARVGVLLPNGVDAVCADQALLSLGLVAVPMHALDNPASIRYILDDCQVALLLVESQLQWRAIADCGLVPEHLRQVVTLQACDPAPPEQRPSMVSLGAWLERTGEPGAVACRAAGADLAAIVYTSGTTGRPKGVMLSHANVLANLRGLMARLPVRADDVFLSVLPLSHTFERTVGYYLPLAAGASVAYARSMALLAEDLSAIRPTVLVAVPRIYEKFHAAQIERGAAAGAAGRALHALTLGVGWRRFCRRQRLPTGGLAMADALLWPLLERLLARAVRERFGARLRAAICGGAPLPEATAQGLLAMGLPLLQGYGMTECSPVVATNGIDDNWPASVGRALHGCEVRLGARDELQVRSASVMLGYWGRPEDSARVVGADGWLSTGDQAVVEQGRIRIVGRIKDILVTSNGEKIAAATVEQAILGDPLFAQAMVIGDNRPYLSALLVLDAAAWRALALRLALDPAQPDSLAAPATQALLLKRVREACAQLPRHAAPRAAWAMIEPWTVENSLLTPTLKLKREGLMARYAVQIAAMYAARSNQPSPDLVH
ncbi:AMP-dependent synthetase/ligase [Duganella violaceipulchra]|uniref:AMP-binding protein n=1 Tax=Duganella violaceipulchra TaxID=2849652 RepID=A0AA41L5P4_9BURK|nr:AMP-binding protein [Duganella violaceicalia]MBV6319390.1 AMP-binding protein [Duganella violaceicalia]MCP2006798.1 long-chain acyl-CoA synthetase [Duganella violaceicalia]